MKVNGVELEDIDLFDAETAERYEKALEGVVNVAKTVEGMKMSEGIRVQCNAVFSVFNTMFGEGTDKKVFGGKTNLLVCLKAFDELVMQINEQKKEIEKITSKYSPNRAQRRTKK